MCSIEVTPVKSFPGPCIVDLPRNHARDFLLTMSSQTTVDNLSTRVDQLDISGRRSPEFTYNDGKLIFMPKVSIHKPSGPLSAFTSTLRHSHGTTS